MKYKFSVSDYSLERTLLSGQVFRWNKTSNSYLGVIDDSLVKLTQTTGEIVADIKAGNISKDRLNEYLDIDLDYNDILKTFPSNLDMTNTINKFKGYRILKQEPFETLISFICSTNSNIPNIRSKVQNLSRMYGKQIFEDYYSFPTADDLAKADEKGILKAKVGYRGKYIIESSKYLTKNNILAQLEKLTDEEAVDELTKLSGVGRKVADCVLLFAYHRLNRVPIDVWMKRILIKKYGQSEKTKYEKLERYAEGHFGKYAGYVSHFLFEHAREGSLL